MLYASFWQHFIKVVIANVADCLHLVHLVLKFLFFKAISLKIACSVCVITHGEKVKNVRGFRFF